VREIAALHRLKRPIRARPTWCRTTKVVLNSSSSLNTPSPLYGGQQVHSVFAEAARHIDTGFKWSPFQDYVYTQMSNDLGNAVNGKTSFASALNTLQSDLVSYAKAQGFTIK